MFTVRGSSMFSKPVLIRSIIAAALGQFYYVVNNMRPDNKLENISPFYFMVLGSCLSFLVVFKSNMAYSRFWEARGHVGAVLNHSRSLMRRIVFSTDMRPGTPDAEEAIHRLHRLLRLFFALLMQDCRLNQDLERVPSDVLTPKEKDELAHVRRRPLMVIGWCQATIRRLAREGHISERISLRMEDHLEAISQAYHGCTKIRSQPMPFSYSQLIALLSLLYCFSVPITFITSFSYAICVPTFVMALVYFGINHVGTELSDPFGQDTNDIALEAFQRQLDEDLGTYIMQWMVQLSAEDTSQVRCSRCFPPPRWPSPRPRPRRPSRSRECAPKCASRARRDMACP
jgi:putative membrane protein